MNEEFKSCILKDKSTHLAYKLCQKSIFRYPPNSDNFLLVAKLWSLMNLPPYSLVEAANSFAPALHRLNKITVIGGVQFWDDSKATNFHATLAALQSFNGPIVWIGGGRSKGGDIQAFIKKVVQKVDVAVLYGEVADCIVTSLGSSPASVHVYPLFEDAVLAAVKIGLSIPHANVLLSPGFSSFDQFKSYKERGKSFTRIVLSLKSPQ